jgi:hypothetical protein
MLDQRWRRPRGSLELSPLSAAEIESSPQMKKMGTQVYSGREEEMVVVELVAGWLDAWISGVG